MSSLLLEGSPKLPPRPRSPLAPLWASVKLLAAAMVVAYIVLALWHTGFNPWKLVEGAQRTRGLLAELLRPDWSIASQLLKLMNETVEIALLGTLIAVLISFPLAFLGSKNLMLRSAPGRVVYFIVRLIFNILRAFEPVLLALLFVIMVVLGPFAGVMALGIHSVGMLGKLFSETIEGIDQGPVEAALASGGNRFQVVWYGILPQVAPQFLAFSIYRWDINIRMSIVLGIVGAGGIGYMLLQYMSLFQFGKLAQCAVHGRQRQRPGLGRLKQPHAQLDVLPLAAEPALDHGRGATEPTGFEQLLATGPAAALIQPSQRRQELLQIDDIGSRQPGQSAGQVIGQRLPQPGFVVGLRKVLEWKHHQPARFEPVPARPGRAGNANLRRMLQILDQRLG